MIIYKTINLISNKIYVGKDSKNDPDYLGSGLLLKRAIKKHGIENFKKEIIEYCNSTEELNVREIYWIKYFNSTDKKIGYNIARGGSGGDTISTNPNNLKIREKQSSAMLGRTFTEEHKKNISKAKKGKPVHPAILTESSRLKMSLAKKGKPLSEEHKKKLSIARQGRKPSLGKKWSEEAKLKHKERFIGKKHLSSFLIQIEINGKIQEFNSALSAAKYFNCNIYRILQNKLIGYNVIIIKNA